MKLHLRFESFVFFIYRDTNENSKWTMHEAQSPFWFFIHISMNRKKQVAQRATIAHLSPICHGQSAPKPYAAFPPPQWCYTQNLIKTGQLALEIFKFKSVKFFITQGQVTPKWVVWSGPKSNMTKLLGLYWLPATFLTIWSKMNELAWRHHFPIISLWEIF